MNRKDLYYNASNILLTGATGVIGGRILLEVLKNTRAKLYCLVRARDRAHAVERIESILSVYEPSFVLDKEIRARIEPLLGDVSKPNLGLDEERYEHLSRNVHLTIHCAANVSLAAFFDDLRPVNVDGTANVVKFCMLRRSVLIYVSSYSVVGDRLYQHDFVYKESDFDVGQNYFEGYEQSKFEAEKIVRNAAAQGLPCVIVRPGNVFGDSENGRYPLYTTTQVGIYYDLLRTIVETGYAFVSAERFDVTPVDYVAKATLFAAESIDETNGKTFHLMNPNPVTFDELVAILNRCGYVIRAIPLEDYIWAVFDNRIIRDDKPYSSNFTKLLALCAGEQEMIERATFGTSQAIELLHRAEIRCPAVDQSLIGRYVKYGMDHSFLPFPEQQRRRLAHLQMPEDGESKLAVDVPCNAP